VALAVAIPVGVWRGRAFSSRFSHLADAADAIGRGELEQRIEITGDDELTRLASRFNDVIGQLQDVDRSRKAFIANVSHELRTPLAIIQGHIERLVSRSEAPVAAGMNRDWPVSNNLDANALETIEREIETLGSLIDDLFTLARLQEAALPLDPRPFQIDLLIQEIVESQRMLAWEQQKIALRSLVLTGLPPVLADSTRVRQILRNLLFNALRHTPEGGIIVVDAVRDGAAIVVSVLDTGLGIAPDEIEHVFDRFYRSERMERDANGSGLGLSVVKQLVEAQGGTICVESEPNHGTTFRFTLPLAASA
jgi:signal transduction histidine kinase